MERIPTYLDDPDEIVLVGPLGTHENGLMARYFYHIDHGFGRLLALSKGGYESDDTVKVVFDEEPWLGEQVLTPQKGLHFLADAMHANVIAIDMVKLAHAQAKSPENLKAHEEDIRRALGILSGSVELSVGTRSL